MLFRSRAYSKTAKIAVDSAKIVVKTLYCDVNVEIDYTLLGKLENELQKNNYLIKNKLFNEKVNLNILCIEEDVEKLKSLILNASSAKCKIEIVNSSYYSVKDGKLID